MRDLCSDDDFILMIVNQKHVAAHQKDAFVDHLRLVFSQDGVIEFLAKKTYSLKDYLREDETFQRAADFGAALFQEKASLGVKRLDADEQRKFWEYAYKIFSVVSYNDFASIFLQNADSQIMADTEIKGIAILSDAELRNYLSLTRDAIFAEIFDDPLYIPLGKTEREIAVQVFEDTFVNNLLDHPRADALANAVEMHEGIPAKDICEFGLLTISSALEIEGAAGGWVIRYLSE